jgi:hypothetical protein
MPSQITLTHEQLRILADTRQTCIVKEVITTATPIEAWVLNGEDISHDQHRSLIIDADGEVLSDTIMDDNA